MPEKITLINERGESTQADVVAVFNINQKKFIVSTTNEIDPNGLVVLHVSEVEGEQLKPVSNDSDWDAIKAAMRTIISGSDK